MTNAYKLQSKVHCYRLYKIRPTGPSTQASYTIGSGTTSRPHKKINRQRKLQLDTISFLRWRHKCHESYGAGGNQSWVAGIHLYSLLLSTLQHKL